MFERYDDWIAAVRVGIYSTYISSQVRDHVRDGKGAPSGDDMRRFADELVVAGVISA